MATLLDPQTDTLEDLLHRLGDVSPARVRLFPSPGTATLDDLIAHNERPDTRVCEWVDGTLVEKAVGAYESWVGFILGGELYIHLRDQDLGMIYGEAAVLRILPKVGRAPAVAFVAWSSLPGAKPPPRSDRVPSVVPDLVIEILSHSNTPREMARKRTEYFAAGVRVVWEVEPDTRSAMVYTAVDRATPVATDGELDGGTVLPGFRVSLKAVFDRAGRTES